MSVLCSSLVRSLCGILFFFFKQKTAYEMRISDWSSDVCSSDLVPCRRQPVVAEIGDVLELQVEAVGIAEFDRRWGNESYRLTGAKIGRASCRERVCQYV